MTDAEIFDLADTHGWQDDFGRWNFKDDGLLEFVHAINMSQERVDETAKDRHEWVEQPDLARVGEVGIWGHKREWVGLTRLELDIATLGLEDLGDCYLAIEAKLKEKNNG
jgi:hypothetical protein